MPRASPRYHQAFTNTLEVTKNQSFSAKCAGRAKPVVDAWLGWLLAGFWAATKISIKNLNDLFRHRQARKHIPISHRASLLHLSPAFFECCHAPARSLAYDGAVLWHDLSFVLPPVTSHWLREGV